MARPSSRSQLIARRPSRLEPRPEGAENEVGNGSLVIVEHTRLDGVEIEISARELQHFPDRTEYRANGVEPIVVRGGKTDEPGGKARMIAKVVGAVMPL